MEYDGLVPDGPRLDDVNVFNVFTNAWENINDSGISPDFVVDDGIVIENFLGVENDVLDLTKKGAANDPLLSAASLPSGNVDLDPTEDSDEEYIPNVESDEEAGCTQPSKRPSRGRKRKIPTQTRADIKKLRNSNETYYNHQGQLQEKKVFVDFKCKKRQRPKKPLTPIIENDDNPLDLTRSIDDKSEKEPEEESEEEEEEDAENRTGKKKNDYCSLVCPTNVPTDVRKKIFQEFYDLASYDAQNLFISSNVTEKPTKQQTRGKNKSGPSREFARTYLLNGTPVCRDMFVKTLQVSTKRVNTALSKSRTLSLQDQRGKPQGAKKALSRDKKAVVTEHIEKFPRYKSHYCRAQSTSEFLDTSMNLTIMHGLYVEDLIGEENPAALEQWRNGKAEVKKSVLKAVDAVSLSTYKRIFHKDFNLKFKPFKKDTCNTCDVNAIKLLNASADEQKTIEKQRDDHFDQVEAARKEFNKDKLEAKKDPTLECLTFDLEKNLTLPRIPANKVYYKRKAYLHNLGVHSCKDDQGFFYVWTENQAGRGAQEVGSCLLKHADQHIPENVEEVRCWCDTCTGQNRNIKITLIGKAILEKHPHLKRICFKFLISGHSFLPNDSDFGDVECALKVNQRLYTPDDYVDVMRKARKHNKFIVSKMSRDDFVGTEVLEKIIVNRKTDEDKKKINWLKFREVKVERAEPMKIFVRNDFESEYQVVDLERAAVKTKRKKQPGKKPEEVSFVKSLKLNWPNGKGIAPKKLEDLKSLLDLVPDDAKPFYLNLTGDEAVVDDFEGFCHPLDFEQDVEEEA